MSSVHDYPDYKHPIIDYACTQDITKVGGRYGLP
jgi:hypothetical protein